MILRCLLTTSYVSVNVHVRIQGNNIEDHIIRSLKLHYNVTNVNKITPNINYF